MVLEDGFRGAAGRSAIFELASGTALSWASSRWRKSRLPATWRGVGFMLIIQPCMGLEAW